MGLSDRSITEFLSTTAEVHAAGVGFSLGFFSAVLNDEGPLMLSLAVATNRDGQPTDSKQWIDARNEPVYVLAASAVGYALGAVIFHHRVDHATDRTTETDLNTL